MLNRLVAFSLKNRLFIVIAAVLIAAYGTFSASKLSIDVLPDLNRPTVTILTEAHAMVPEDVERLVTFPLEQSLNGATGVMRVRSSSGTGLSVIFVEFNWGTDIYRNRQIVQEKLQLATTKMPPGIEPQMAPISSIMGQIQFIGIRSKDNKTDVTELRALADYNIKYRLLSIPGVANIVAIGGAPRQLQVIVDAEKLNTFDVTVQDVAEAIEDSNKNASGGFLNIGSKGPVITVTGLIQKKEELESAVIKYDEERPVRISDVARVDFGPAAIKTGEAGVDGGPGVILVIFKQVGTDTVELTKRINEELEIVQKSLAKDVEIIPNVFQQASFIERAIKNVEEAILDGGILVVIILFVFLLNFRTTFITLTAIPLSIALTIIVFSAFGLSINTMTLGGLAVAIGALVDDAIVGLENIFRRLKQNAQKEKPQNSLWVIFKAVSEVRKAIVIGTLLVIVVYLPLFFLSGLEGKLFTPIGITYILSVGCSLLVSLTVTPALCYYLLTKSSALKDQKDSFVVRKLKVRAEQLIRFSIKHSLMSMALLTAFVVVGMVMLATRGSQFLPEFNEGTAQINLILPPETGLETSDEYGRRLEQVLMTVKGVEHVGRRTGRAEGDEHAEGVGTTEAILSLDPESGRTKEEIVGEIREKIADEFPGVATAVDQPLAHLLSHMLSGVKAQVAIKVFGPDLDQLRKIAKEVESAIKPINGVKDLYVESQVLIDRISVNPKREQLAQFGLKVNDIAETVELAMGGEAVSQMTVGQYVFPMILRLEEKDRKNMDNIKGLYVKDEGGNLIVLSDVADVGLTKTPNNINREHVARRIVVQHNVAERSLGEVVEDVTKALAPIEAGLADKPGYSIRISGQFEAQQEAQKRITVLSVFSLLIMGLILFMHFKSITFSIQVMMSIPMAFIGAVAYIVISGQTVSIATLVGLISLGGVAARNAILLLDHYMHLMKEEGEPFSIDMIVRAGQERMVPVVMTALTSGIALVPIALSPGEPGREILYPVATVIVGGLMSSTLLEFVVAPAMFWTFGRKAAEHLAAIPEPRDRAAEELAEELEELNHRNPKEEI